MFGNLLNYDSLPVPSSFVSLFIFYIFPYHLSKTMGCFSGCLMSSASGQKFFCEVCLAFKCSFDEFVGEKVVSLSYSSAILAPPPPSFLNCFSTCCVFLNIVHIFRNSALATKLCPTLVTAWTIALQAALPVGFPKEEYWSGLPFPSPGESFQSRDHTQVSSL